MRENSTYGLQNAILNLTLFGAVIIFFGELHKGGAEC